MDALIANMQENAMLYGAIAVCLAPIIYVTRKYSVPVILYCVEFAIYALIMHVVVWVIVAVTRWFKESSSMRALDKDGIPEDAPEWGTPLVEFWDTEAYDPNWVWKAELVCLVLVLIVMWRYRPMKVQRKPQRGTQEFGKSSARSKPNSFKAADRGKGGKPTRGRRGR